MSISDKVINGKTELGFLQEFVKLPEHKRWLGRIATLFDQLEASAQLSTDLQVYNVGSRLTELSATALELDRAARFTNDFGDHQMIAGFHNALLDRYRKSLSPEMRARYPNGVNK